MKRPSSTIFKRDLLFAVLVTLRFEILSFVLDKAISRVGTYLSKHRAASYTSEALYV